MNDKLRSKFQTREAILAVVGLGYVGLPLAVAFAEAGFSVYGLDVDPHKVDALNRGHSHVEDIPDERLTRIVTGQYTKNSGQAQGTQPTDPKGATGSLQATTDFSVLSQCDGVSICVPTPLNKTGDPDISYIVKASEQIARYLHAGMTIILESTTYPGTTTEVVLPILIGGQGSKPTRSQDKTSTVITPNVNSPKNMTPPTGHLRVGYDFYLAFSPERIDPGRTDWTLHTTPKVIGGVTPNCLEVACGLYETVIDTLIPVSCPEAAELTKLYENIFRSVNIGLANELLLMCDKLGLDAWEILEAADTKPFGFMKFTPGPGLGGHCIPVDPHYLSWKLKTVKYNARFIELASEINTDMPRFWVQKVQDALNEAGKPVKGSTVLILGVAYKRNVSDLRESPALDIIRLLKQKGADVFYHDPYVPSFEYEGLEMVCVDDLEDAIKTASCVLIATDHIDYDWKEVAKLSRIVVDTRHVIPVQ